MRFAGGSAARTHGPAQKAIGHNQRPSRYQLGLAWNQLQHYSHHALMAHGPALVLIVVSIVY
jgi:hypothetical protein